MERERRIMLRVTERLHKAVRVRAAEEGCTISDIVRALLQLWLDGKIDLNLSGEKKES